MLLRTRVGAAAAAVSTMASLGTTAAQAEGPAAAQAVTGSISVDLARPQQLGPVDPASVRLVATAQTNLDCSNGCHLVHWRYIDSRDGSLEYEKVATCTFPGGSTHTCTTTYVDDDFTWYFAGASGFLLCRGSVGTEAGCAEGHFPVTAMPDVEPDSHLTLGPGWQRDVDLAATETMILRSAVRGARVERPKAEHAARVGIISQTGPRAGVLRALVNGSAVLTVDLRRATQSVRQVVGSVTVPAGATLALENATPAGRTNADVTVDALVPLIDLPGYEPARGRGGGASRRLAPLTSTAPVASIVASPTVGGSLSPDLTSLDLDVIAKVPGCPKVCRIVNEGWVQDPVTLLTKESPASATLQTLRATHRARVDDENEPRYTLYQSPDDPGYTTADGNPARDEQNWSWLKYGFTYSRGWTLDSNRTVTEGKIERSSTPGTGATYRAWGFMEGREVGLVAAKGRNGGVMKVYNDGRLISTIDLYSATWQPRVIVAATSLKLRGRLTVVNASPASRPGKDVHVDAVVTLGGTNDWYRMADRPHS